MTQQTSRLRVLGHPPPPLDGYWGVDLVSSGSSFLSFTTNPNNSGQAAFGFEDSTSGTPNAAWSAATDLTLPSGAIPDDFNGLNMGASGFGHYVTPLYISYPGYFVYQDFLEFDTSRIPTSTTIKSATLKLWGQAIAPIGEYTAEVYAYNYGTLTYAAMRTRTQLNSLTLLCSYSSMYWNYTGLKTMSNSASNLAAAIEKGGSTRLLVCLSSNRNANCPVSPLLASESAVLRSTGNVNNVAHSPAILQIEF